MGVTERKARQKESLRQEILDAARQILLGEGMGQLSMRRIADRIEYTPTTIYLHFRDKADLIFHLCEEVYGKVADAMKAAGAGEKDPLTRLGAMMRAYIEFGLSEPDSYRIAFMTDVFPTVDSSNFLKAGSRASNAYELVREAVRKVIGAHRHAEVDAVAQALWATAHGMVSLVIDHRDFPWVDRETLVETGISLVSGALGAPPARAAKAGKRPVAK